MHPAARHLAANDAAFARLLADAPDCELGQPFHESDLETLVFAVIGQQISAKAADAITLRLLARTGRPLAPPALLDLGDQGLRDLGFTRSKARTCLGLAEAMSSGDLDVDALRSMTDEALSASVGACYIPAAGSLELNVEGIRWTYVFYESGLSINVLYTLEDPKKRAVGFKLSDGDRKSTRLNSSHT